ncbi:TPR repeat-containing protein [Thermoflavifilum thermophilum]|uniref:TPR repeat-containing protein n=2 Tax=Thermoflavifilum thermophilum TaxID=1393122 RepID=A0A1I7NBM6_9BACT|nr:TPR repeat-containing protein [Thermoflavifilum thermophilum]
MPLKPAIQILALCMVVLCSPFRHAVSQSPAADRVPALYATAQRFMSAGDYANAIIVLQQVIQQDPTNQLYQEDLATAYLMRKDYPRAEAIINSLLKNKSASVRTYQLAAEIAEGQQDDKKAIRLLNEGIRQFPHEGALYHQLGLLYFNEENYKPALQSWIKGIQMAPSYANNYYQAARTYYYTDDMVWTLLYGEIFINLESFTLRTAEIKGILFDTYKRLFASGILSRVPLPLPGSRPASFREAFLQTLAKQAAVADAGITPETLTMLRIRFILDWENLFADDYPFALFDYQAEMIRAGVFEAYNQWLFGPAADAAAFREWMNLHSQDMQKFLIYHQQHPLQLPAGEYYNDGRFRFQTDNQP